MPTGSGSAIIAAGSCRIGVRSFQLEAMNSAEATPLAALGNEVEHDAHERVVAAPVGDGAADERQDRKRQSRGLVGPEKRLLEIGPRQNIGQDQAQFAEQGSHEDGFGKCVDGTQDCVRRCAQSRLPTSGYSRLNPDVCGRGERLDWIVRSHARNSRLLGTSILVYLLPAQSGYPHRRLSGSRSGATSF